MAQLDASIPLSVKTFSDYQKDRATELQVQALQDEATQRKLSLQQQQSLRDAFSGADTSTAEGQQSLIKKVQGIDPNTAIKLQKEFVEQGKSKAQTAEIQAKTEHSKIQTAIEKNDMVGRAAMSVKEAYQGARESGKSEEEAVQAGAKERIRAMTSLYQNGVINEDQLKQFIVTPFDPRQLDPVINNSMSVKDQLTKRLEQSKFEQTKKDEDARRAETARHNRAEEGLAGGRLQVERGRLALEREKMGNEQDVEGQAQAIANGQLPAPTGNASRSPYAQKLMARVLQINPTFDAADFSTKSKAVKDFATGKQGSAVRSFNVSISHLDTLDKLVDALGTGDAKALNKVSNAWREQTGNEAPTNFDAAKKIVADEIVKAIVGSGGGVTDREEAARVIDKANSPAQLKGVIKTYKELMGGQLKGLQKQYEETTGRKDFDRFLTDEAKKETGHVSNQNINPIQKGNIDLNHRPIVKNDDGSISTVRSFSTNIDGKEVLLPTVGDEGKIISEEEAIRRYKKNGKHLGIFRTPEEATAYAIQLHKDQEKQYVNKSDYKIIDFSSLK